MGQRQSWDGNTAIWPHGPGVSRWLHKATGTCHHSHLDPVPSANTSHSFPIQLQVTSCIFRHLLSWPFLCHFLPRDPRASPISFPLSHQLHLSETTSLNCLWHPGTWQLSVALLFICSCYLSLPLNSEMVLLSLHPKVLLHQGGYWKLAFCARTCIYRMQLEKSNMYLYCNWTRLDIGILKKNRKILYCTKYVVKRVHWHSCEQNLKLCIWVHIWNVYIHFQMRPFKKSF